MFCKYCGTKNEGKVKFCKNCGREIKKFRLFSIRSVYLKGGRKKIFVFPLLLIVVIIAFLILVLPKYKNNPDQENQVSVSVVNILCDNESGGSGTIISSDGYVVTNNHVIFESKACLVTIPNTSSGAPEEIYIAEPIIIPTLSEQYDIAMLKIDMAYTDSDGKVWGVFPKSFVAYQRPEICHDYEPKLEDDVRIFGYPVASGGLNLTITNGIISSFSEYNEILTSAKIDSGNSGGLAVNKDGCMLGIPSAVLTGEYENLGVIIPNSTILEFLNKISTE